MTFIEFLEEQYSAQTIKSYVSSVDHFLLHCQAEKASHRDIIAYLDKHKSKSTARTLAAFKQYFDYLIVENKREDHPCRSLTIKRERKDIQHQDLFSSKELRLLLDKEERYAVLKNRNKALISLLIYQGLTPQNIVNLRVKDIDLDSGVVYVKATRQLSRRSLELKPSQVLLFYKYVFETRDQLLKSDTEMLFLSKIGSEISVDTLNRILRPLQGLYSDKNLNASTIRQSVIMNWINEDMIPLEDVQLLVGHKWLSSTEKYRIIDRENKREKINRFFPF